MSMLRVAFRRLRARLQAPEEAPAASGGWE